MILFYSYYRQRHTHIARNLKTVNITVKHLDNYTLIKVVGRFNAATSLSAQPIFNELIQHIDKNIHVDLSETRYIDTSGIGALVFLFKRLHIAGLALELIGVHGQPLCKIRALGLDHAIKISSLLTTEKKLIVFGEDWGRFPSSTQYLINGLLKLGWTVIWINSIGMRNPKFNWTDVRRITNKLYQYFRGKTPKFRVSLPANLTVINPMVIPVIGYSLVDKINCFFLKKQLASTIHKNKFATLVVWMTLPTAYPYAAIFGQWPLVYYCCDDYAVIGDSPHPQIPSLEKQLVNQASLVIVVSDVLATKMPSDKTLYLDHGIDLNHFRKSYSRPHDLPSGKPVAGFYGSIASWVDINLIYQCVSKLCDVNFVLIGPSEVDLSQLKKLSNFFYLGFKPYEEIPAYSQHWDVGMIPFVKSQLTAALNPLKIKEYLTTGKPVVSVDLPAMQAYKGYIYIAKDEDEFINALQLAINEKGQSRKSYDITHHGWDSRAMLLEKKLLSL